MSYEILYTSAPSGLKPGSSGYCTVQGSRGIPAPAVDLLESLSGYRHVFTPGSPDATHNPVNWGHYLIRIAGRVEHVLSRVGDCELDYTGRSNKLAHHLVVDAPTTATLPGGPAWFLSRPGLMYDQWDGTVSHLGTPRIPPPERRTAGQCAAWGGATGDAGWGGVLAEAFLAAPERKVFVVYAPGTNVLALFEEAIALLPEHRRWDVTFATYGAALPKTVDCLWSGIVAGSPEVAQSHRFVNALRIDLTIRPSRASGGPLVELARTGVSSTPSRSSTRPSLSPQQSASPEPIYESGYQPVPPPPGTFATIASEIDPIPPSLPPRPSRKHGVLRIGTAIAGAALFVAVLAAAALFWPRQPRSPDGDKAVTESERPTTPEKQTEKAAGADSREISPKPQAEDSAVRDSQRSVTKQDPDSPKEPNAEMPRNNEGSPGLKQSETVKPVPSEEPTANSPQVVGQTPQPPSPTIQRITASKRPSLLSPSHKDFKPDLHREIQIQLDKNDKPKVTTVTHATFLVPKSKLKENLFDLAGQSTQDGQLTLTPTTAKPGFAPILLAIEVGNPSKIVMRPRTITDAQLTSASLGAILLYDETSGNTSIIQLLNEQEVSIQSSHATEREFHVTIPKDLQQSISDIPASDFVLSDVTLTVQKSPQPDVARLTDYSWNLSRATNNVFTSISITADGVDLISDRVRFAYTVEPHVSAVAEKNTKDLTSLESSWNLVEREIGEQAAAQLPDVVHPIMKPSTPPASLEQAGAKLTEMVLNAPRPNKLTDEQTKTYRNQLSNYLDLLQTFRTRALAIETISNLRLKSGKISYKVWPIKVALKGNGVAALPAPSPDLMIDLFKFRSKD